MSKLPVSMNRKMWASLLATASLTLAFLPGLSVGQTSVVTVTTAGIGSVVPVSPAPLGVVTNAQTIDYRYTNSTLVTFQAVPNGSTYRSFAWTLGGVPFGSSLSTNFTVTGNTNLTATFTGLYSLRLGLAVADRTRGYISSPVEVHSTMTPITYPSSYEYLDADSVRITAVPSNGYSFVSWSYASGSDTVASFDTNSASVDIQFIAGHTNLVTLQASFKAADVFDTLTIVSTNNLGLTIGNPQPPAGSRTFLSNTLVNAVSVTDPVIVSASEQWRPRSYTSTGSISPTNGSGVSSIAPFNITTNTTLIWKWEPEYKLTYTNVGSGFGTVVLSDYGSGGWYTNNQVVTLTATPASGSSFTGWSGAVTTNSPSITVTMNAGKSLFANFGPAVVTLVPLTIVSTNKNGVNVGEPWPTYGTTNFVQGSNLRPTVTSPYVLNPPTERVIVDSYTGTGDAPSGPGGNASSFTINSASSLKWNWNSQYLLTIEIHGDGSVSRNPGGDPSGGTTNLSFWYDAGTTVSLNAAVMGASKYLTWGGAVPVSGSANTSVTMNSNKTVSVTFTEQALDSDNDGLPDDWERKFGLDYTKPDASGKPTDGALGDSGAFGDPDNDGLPNLLEYQITHILYSNLVSGVVECNPANADSDGDGIDDGYEYYNMLPQNVVMGTPGSQTNALAVVNPRGIYGPDGNPDGDCLWNTQTGYVDSNSPLTTIMEYVGPDGIVPATWDTPINVGVTNGGGTFVISNVFRKVLNPLDTDDQSSSDSTDSEIASFNTHGDGFDDGFEYTWDVWQGQYSGDPIGDPLGRTIPQRFGVGPAPTAAAIGDINGDQKNDLAVCNYNYGDVGVYFSSNNLLYLQSKRYPVGAGPVAIVMGGLHTAANNTNGDLVVVNKLGNSVTVLLTDPTNVYNSVTYSVGSSPVYAALGDFNGDASIDIAVANSGDGTISILTNDTLGGFASYATIPGVGTPSCIAAGSVFAPATTNTLYQDLLVADTAGSQIRVIRNTAGVFAQTAPIVMPGRPSSIVIGDFDRDAVNDFAVTILNNDVNSLQTYRGQGAGAFAFNQRLWCGEKASPLHLAAGYLDTQLSNDLDVAIASTSNSTGRIFLGSRNGSLISASSVTLLSAPVWVALGDINNDGTNDLVFVCRDQDFVSIYTGFGNGRMGAFGDLATATTLIDRRFNPHKMHPQEPDGGKADYDLIYKPTGGVGGWFTDNLEYHAWDIGLYSNTIIRTEYPNLPRCTNPFLWDTDGDGMPDGWEIVFGYDPWDRNTVSPTYTDAEANPDGDCYAVKGDLIHNEVYQSLYDSNDVTLAYHDFNPSYGWQGPGFVNRLEMLGGRDIPAVVPDDPNDRSTNPRLVDTDKDGMWDGWEHYVGLNPIDPEDGGADPDGDGLSNVQEFLCPGTLRADGWTFTNGGVTVTGVLTPAQIAAIQANISFVTGWKNKGTPTDPFDADTDSDQIPDGAEMAAFNYMGAVSAPVMIGSNTVAGISTVTYLGGGLSPTSADTDGDCMPDRWEVQYQGSIIVTNAGGVGDGMNGALADAFEDYDGDGLLNFQEYMTGAIPHWQYRNNNGDMLWQKGLGLYGYDPFNFFDERLSTSPAFPNGDNSVSYGGRRPKYWDPHYMMPPLYTGDKTPWNFLTAATPLKMPSLFSTTSPIDSDSDWDSMDDYWEVYHMLNPCRGVRDLVSTKVLGLDAYELFDFDIQAHPWVNGDWETDSDQDGLPNVYESIQAASPVPSYYHTDPTPYWMSDISYDQSWANLYYWSGFNFGMNNYYYWFRPYTLELGSSAFPQYLFDFEMNEGFDTDNDNIGDRAELVSNASKPGKTDPLDAGDPIKRRALYLNGNAAARTFMGTIFGWNQMRMFTVEAWVRPSNPISGAEQVIVERPGFVANGNPMGYASGIRLNFRLGLDPNGCPFVGYNGGGYDTLFAEAKTGPSLALKANQWTHLAGVFDGESSKLILYVNGQMAAMTPSGEIPFNGHFGPAPTNTVGSGTFWQSMTPMPIIVGARESNPDGKVNGSTILVTSLAGTVNTDPALDHYFTGWVDEIRIWSGARSQSDIRDNLLRRYTMKDVTEINASRASTAALLYAYGFDDLSDPDHSGVAPAGFELLTGYPNFGTPYAAINWWATAPDRSRVYNEYRYLPWIKNLSSHTPRTPPSDSTITPVTNIVVVGGVTNFVVSAFPNTSNPYTFQYRTETKTTFPDEAHPFLTASDGLYGDLLPLRWAQGDEDVALWDNGTVPALTPYDSDGDGMPDDWEVAHGLDPRDGTGDNGAEGDPDGDGLSNLAEYLSGTNPHGWDTDGDGLSDYDSRKGQGSRTWGELYDDGDGIPDLWELQYPGPCPTTGKRGLDPAYYDANLDPDEDGWDNYSEYMVNSNPLDSTNYPTPMMGVHVRYAGRWGTTLANSITGGGRVRLSFYHDAAMDGYPDATLAVRAESVVTNVMSIGHIRQGKNYIFAFLDRDDNNEWDPSLEPAGIAQFQPVNFGWGAVNDMEIGLTDEMSGYPRFTWPADATAYKYIITYDVGGVNIIRRIINGPRNYFHEGDYLYAGLFGVAPDVAPTFLIYKDKEPDGYLTFVAAKEVPTVTLATPSVYTSNGNLEFQYARNELEFKVDANATCYSLQIAANSNGTPIISTTAIVPYMDNNGVRKVPLPFYAGDNYVPPGGNYASAVWGNGLYWTRVQAATPMGTSAFSPWSSFLVNVQPPVLGGRSTISGDLYYLGKVGHGYGGAQASNLTVIVQAFQSPGFSGEADGQVQVTYNCNTNSPSINKGAYTLIGLRNAPYYVRAFIDENGNRQLDSWEPMGFAQQITSNGYQAVGIDLTGQGSSAQGNIRVVIRDRDTDDDGVPDGWEWMYYGSLANMSSNIAANGMTLLRNYEIEPMDLDPTKTDYDGDGVSDVDEITYSDLVAGRAPDISHYDPYNPVTNPNGTDLNPTKWDTDGDGLSDGYELAHGMNPINPADGAAGIARALAAGETIPGAPSVYQVATVTPDAGQFSLSWLGQIGMGYEVQYSDDLKIWQPAPNGDRYGAAVHTYVDQSPKVTSRFYRVVVR